MDKDLTTESLSATEFGRRSIQRFVQRPGLLRLDTIRGQADRVSRMTSNRMPVLEHVQRYMPGNSSDLYGERQLLTYAHPVGRQHGGMETGSQAVSGARGQTSNHASPVLSTGVAQIQRSIAPASPMPAGAKAQQGSSSVQSNPDKQGRLADTPSGNTVVTADTNKVISEPIINRYLQTPMIMQKVNKDNGLISRTTAVKPEDNEDENAGTAPLMANVQRAMVQTGPVLSGFTLQRSVGPNNTTAGIVEPETLGAGIIRRYTDMLLAKPIQAMQQPNHSGGLTVSAAPMVQRAVDSAEEEKQEPVQAASIQASPMTPFVQHKADNPLQATASPASDAKQNRLLPHVATVLVQPTATGARQEQSAFYHNDHFGRAMPDLPLSKPGSTGTTLFRKPADNVLSFNTEQPGTENHSNVYANKMTMPVVSTINRMSDKSVIARSVDTGMTASNETSSAAEESEEQSASGTPAVTDELIDKIFSRLLRRMAVESERRGWRF